MCVDCLSWARGGLCGKDERRVGRYWDRGRARHSVDVALDGYEDSAVEG